MLNKIRATLIIGLGLGAWLLSPTLALATGSGCSCHNGQAKPNTPKCIALCAACSASPEGCDNANEDKIGGLITTIINTLLFLIGALSVVMIIVGGFRYVTSAGNASSIESAKKTILYAVVGLVVALLAFAIVQFVVSRL